MHTQELIQRFSACSDANERYSLLMEIGDSLPPFQESDKTEERRVLGCQSSTYLKVDCREGKVAISGTSDAKISKGLLALLIYCYEGKEPAALFTIPFTLPQEIGLPELLSPSRSQGLLAMQLHLKKAVIPFLK